VTYLSTYFLAWAGLAGVFQKVVTPFGSAQQGMTLFGVGKLLSTATRRLIAAFAWRNLNQMRPHPAGASIVHSLT
jgi:hypothetical protein